MSGIIIISIFIMAGYQYTTKQNIDTTLRITKGEFFEKKGGCIYFQGMQGCVHSIDTISFGRIDTLRKKMGKNKDSWIIKIDDNTTIQIQGIRSEVDSFLVFTVKEGEEVQNLVFADLNDHVILTSFLYSHGYYLDGSKSRYAKRYIIPHNRTLFIERAINALDELEAKLVDVVV